MGTASEGDLSHETHRQTTDRRASLSTRLSPRPLPTIVATLETGLAYGLAVCWPGAGHCVRREWARGCTWAVLFGAALVFLSSGRLLATGGVAAPPLITMLRLEPLGFGDVAMPLTVLLLNVLDLYALAALGDTATART